MQRKLVITLKHFIALWHILWAAKFAEFKSIVGHVHTFQSKCNLEDLHVCWKQAYLWLLTRKPKLLHTSVKQSTTLWYTPIKNQARMWYNMQECSFAVDGCWCKLHRKPINSILQPKSIAKTTFDWTATLQHNLQN